MLSFFLSLTLANAQSLTVGGSCPGPMTIQITGVTPGGTIGVLRGTGAGSEAMPGGPCAGGRTGLSGLSFLTTLTDSDGDGRISISPSVPGGFCGDMIQVVDTRTCRLSGTAMLGDGGGVAFEHELWVGGYAYASIDDQPVDAPYGSLPTTCQTTPYPLPEGWEIAPNVPDIADITYMGAWGTHCMVTVDGCTWGTSNYSYGNCYAPCGLMGTDGTNYWVTSCSRRVMIRRPL